MTPVQIHDHTPIAVLGLGPTGLALAVALGQKRPVLAHDTDSALVARLQAGCDPRGEISQRELGQAHHLRVCADLTELATAEVFIMTVPPWQARIRQADLSPWLQACEQLAPLVKPGDLVIWESTPYPGAVEELCLPTLARLGGLRPGQDIAIGFSPAAPAPGAPLRSLLRHRKVTAGLDASAAAAVDMLYRQICPAGTLPAPSIRVAEALQLMENAQRHLAQALMNELSLLYPALGVDLTQVLQLAQAHGGEDGPAAQRPSAWQPGLPVHDPVCRSAASHLADRAHALGLMTQVLPASSRVNDHLAEDLAHETVRQLRSQGLEVPGARILVLGLSSKPNCADLDGSEAAVLVRTLQSHGAQVDVYDPFVTPAAAQNHLGLDCLSALPPPADGQDGGYCAVIVAVPHLRLRALGRGGVAALGGPGSLVHDPFGLVPPRPLVSSLAAP